MTDNSENWFDIDLPDDQARVYWVGEAPPPESPWLCRMQRKHRRRRLRLKREKL